LCATEQPLYTVRAHILDTTRPHLAREANATHDYRGFGRVWFWPGFLGRPEPLLTLLHRGVYETGPTKWHVALQGRMSRWW
jgi:hypothetical protein